MISVSIDHDNMCADFAKAAHAHFLANPNHHTFTKDELQEGELLAIRWNENAIVVVQLDDFFKPRLYSTYQLK